MKKKPDKILLTWVAFLCFLGAYINIMSILKYNIPVSHVTGTYAKGITLLFEGTKTEFLFIICIPLSFFIGSMISGIVFSSRVFIFGKLYGIYLYFLGIIVFLGTYFLYNKSSFLFLLTLVVGMQNGMFVSYNGNLCRTTHLTGTTTDLGTLIGNHLAGNRLNTHKIHYYFWNLVSSIFGLIMGYITHSHFPIKGFYFPCAAYFIIGTMYFYIRNKYYKDLVI